MSIDLANPPIPTSVTVYILSKEISYEVLVDRMKEWIILRRRTQFNVDYYSVVLEQPLIEGEEKPAPDGERLYLYDFPAENLQRQDLIDLIKQHQTDWEENHKK